MTILERIRMILEAIKGSKDRARTAAHNGELMVYRRSMEDVIALEATLVGEVESLMDDIDKAA